MPFPAGGSVDLTARTVAQKLGASLGQSVIVDNRPGAATIIGTEIVAKSPPDGYTWLIVSNGITINPSVYKKLPYDTLADLAPVTLGNPLASVPLARAGKLRALGASGSRRIPSMPELPTIAESGVPGYESGQWYGLYTAAATPRKIVAQMQAEVERVLALADVKRTLSEAGAEMVGSSPEQFAAFTKAEISKWAKVVRLAGVTAE